MSDVDEKEHLFELLRTKERVLRALEIQAAQYSSHAPPHIILQIQDLQSEISDIQQNVEGFGDTKDSRTGCEEFEAIEFADRTNILDALNGSMATQYILI